MTERKTGADLARLPERIADGWHPEAGRVALAVGDLGTHKPAVPYEVPAPARRGG